ncbi:MAG: hypothetical protein ACE5DY_04850 [Mariprofundaceae bacterium]
MPFSNIDFSSLSYEARGAKTYKLNQIDTTDYACFTNEVSMRPSLLEERRLREVIQPD